MSKDATASKPRARAAAAARAWNPPTWAAWGAVAGAAVVWVVIVWGSGLPYFGNDDIANLVYGARLAAPGFEWDLTGWSYMPGMALLYAPLWWISDDPQVIARGASVIVAAIGVLTMWPLTRLAQALGLKRNAAMIVAAIVVVAPGRALPGNYYWGETLLGLAVALLALTGLRLARDRTAKNAALFALAAATVLAAHGRALVVVAVAGLALLGLARTQRRVAAVGAATYVAACGAVLLVYRYLSATNFRDQRADRTLSSLSDGGVGDGVVAATSQAWYHVASWGALAILGVALLVRMARTGDDRWWARWTGGAAAAMLIFVVLILAKPRGDNPRLDGFAYGRYAEGVTYLLAFLGLVAVVKGVSARTAQVAAATALAVGLLYLAIVVPLIPAGGFVVPAHTAGVFLWLTDLRSDGGLSPWVTAALASMVLGVVSALVSRFRTAALALMAAYFLAYTTVADVGYLRTDPNFGDGARTMPGQVEGIMQLPDDATLAVDSRLALLQRDANRYSYFLYPIEFVWYTPGVDERPSDAVLGRLDWTEAAEAGALPLNGSLFVHVSNPATGAEEATWVWVFPGPLQDELNARGVLAQRSGQ